MGGLSDIQSLPFIRSRSRRNNFELIFIRKPILKMRFSFIVLGVIFVISAVPTWGQNQRAVLYAESNGLGDYLVVPEDYIEDLSSVGFNDRIRSVCVTGIWLFYQNTNYNTGSASGMEYVFGKNNYCVNIRTIAGTISSVRYAGPPKDYKQSSFTLYQGDYFQGEEEYLLTDAPDLNLAGDHKSIIITGDDCWTIYDQSNFKGNQVCLSPPEPGSNNPSFITDVSLIEAKKVPAGSIRSVRKGCICNELITLNSFARSAGQKSFSPVKLV